MDSLNIIPIFHSLPEDFATACARACIWKEYEPHEMVIEEHDHSVDVRFIICGKVRIINLIAAGKQVILGEMGDGEFFGEISAIDGECRSANVTALTKTTICIMPQSLFFDICWQYRDICLAVMKVLTGRIRELNIRISEYSFLQTKYRLYAELIRLSKKRPANPAHRAISPPPIQQELAERIGTRREVVSRELAALEKNGVVEKNNRVLIICNPQELQNRISSALAA